MKNKIVKVIPVALMGISLTACTVLSDLGIGGKGDITKFAKNKNEVSLREFIDKAAKSVKDTDYVKDDYQMPDSKLIAGIKATASQKLTNDRLANKTRNSASLKLDFTADGAYDKDNDSIKANLDGSYNISEKNAIFGEASSKLETKMKATFMSNGRDVYNNNIYALADDKNQMYRNITVGEDFNLGTALSFGMNRVMKSLASISVGEQFDEASFNQRLAQYGLSLRYYDDNNVMTVTATMDYTIDLQEEKYHYDYIYNEELGYYQNVKVVDGIIRYGNVTIKANLKFQFKVVKVVKLRAMFDGTITAEYTENHGTLYEQIWPLSPTGLPGECLAGDREEITLKAEAGINLEHESVTNKLPALPSYTNVTPPRQ